MHGADHARDLPCAIFWDMSNIFYPARNLAAEREGPTAARDLRIQFDAIWDLARAGRKVLTGVCVGSLSKVGIAAVSQRLRSTGVAMEMFERGERTGREQAVDQALQVHMLRAIVDHPPGVAVLLTGDGGGYSQGKGFHADLERMWKRGWHIELLSWDAACHARLKAWAKDKGVFIPLEDYYDSITFIEGMRSSVRRTYTRRPPPTQVQVGRK